MWLSICLGSVLCRLRMMGGVCFPIILVMVFLSVLIIYVLLGSARAFSLATRYTLSFGLETLGDLLCRG